MKFKRLAAAVMAATMCGSLFVGCGNAKKDDTAAGLSLIHISEPTRP